MAKAEYSVRTFCAPYERLPRDAVFSTPDEDTRALAAAQAAAVAVRPLLTAAIADLKTRFPDRPKSGRARINWLLALEGEGWDTACYLSALEEKRRDIARHAKNGAWGGIRWELDKLDQNYPTVTLTPDLLRALGVLNDIHDRVSERRRAAAQALEDEAVAHRIAYRATDEAWAKELERRAAIDSPRVIRIH